MAKTVNARTLPVQSIGYKYGKLIIPPYEVDVEFTPQEEAALDSGINADMIPSAAGANNQLADKQYVDDNIASASATFKGNYNQVTDLNLTVAASHSDVETALASVISTVDKNDYCYVDVPTSDLTPTQIEKTERYKFNGTSWDYEYSPTPAFSAAQWAALNSGITDTLVEAFGAKYDLPSGGIPDTDLSSGVQSSLGAANSAYQLPNGGIPKTDLASDVQTSLGKADTAIQDAYSTTQADNKFVDSTQIRHIVSMTQAEYDLITPDANTLYCIIQL